MFKKIAVVVFSGLVLMNIYGCFLLVAGGAGAGTAVWLSDKLTQQFEASYDQTINASKKALRSLNLELTKETRDENVCQLRSKYTDGKEIWIDIRKVTDNSTKVDIRVGAINSDKEASSNILKRIKRYL